MPNRRRLLLPIELAEPFLLSCHCRIGAGKKKADLMRSILLWLIGIPVPIILLLALCTHHF